MIDKNNNKVKTIETNISRYINKYKNTQNIQKDIRISAGKAVEISKLPVSSTQTSINIPRDIKKTTKSGVEYIKDFIRYYGIKKIIILITIILLSNYIFLRTDYIYIDKLQNNNGILEVNKIVSYKRIIVYNIIIIIIFFILSKKIFNNSYTGYM